MKQLTGITTPLPAPVLPTTTTLSGALVPGVMVPGMNQTLLDTMLQGGPAVTAQTMMAPQPPRYPVEQQISNFVPGVGPVSLGFSANPGTDSSKAVMPAATPAYAQKEEKIIAAKPANGVLVYDDDKVGVAL